MRDLSTPIEGQMAASASGWIELVDIYLRRPLVTSYGEVDTLRLGSHPAGYQFFTPKLSPEPEATRGGASLYHYWPFKRRTLSSATSFSDKKIAIAASNVLGEMGTLINTIDWQDLYLVIRTVSTTIENPTADDCAVLFIGQIDSVKLSLEQVQIVASSSLGNFSTTLPAEDMHAACRFRWGDDQCTALRWGLDNHKQMVCGAGCSPTRLLERAQLYSGAAVTLDSDTGKVLLTAHGLTDGEMVSLLGTLPAELVSGRWYYVVSAAPDDFKLSDSIGGSAVLLSTVGSDVTLTTRTALAESGAEDDYGTDLIAGLLDAAITASSEMVNYEAWRVRAGSPAGSFWMFYLERSNPEMDNDWGLSDYGYWRIPTAQAGIANPELTPWIQFDFGTAKTPRCWRFSTLAGVDREDMVRLCVVFSSPNGTSWSHEGYFELQPKSDAVLDFMLPRASTARYWRICVRNLWGESLTHSLFGLIRAYEGGRNFWAHGQVKFSAATATAELRGLAVPITSSWAGGMTCRELPVAPAAGDVATVSRGCPRHFAGCCERGNWENYGGFDSLPQETIARS